MTIELDIMDHPLNDVFRVIYDGSDFEIRRCVGDYSEDIENSDGPEWILVEDKQELLDIYKYIILKNVDFKLLSLNGTLDHDYNNP